MVVVVVVVEREVREDRQSERGSKKGRGEEELQTDRCFSWSAKKSKARKGGGGRGGGGGGGGGCD